ncbi:MAG: hypothetical protein V4457_02030 [Pseudomonadota bacterium]
MKPEALTVRSLALGALLGAASAYLGLYAGLTVSASIPAAMMGVIFTIPLRHLLINDPACPLPRGPRPSRWCV